MSEKIISNLQKEKIIAYLNEGKRFDGRKNGEYRKITVEEGISKNSASAVRVNIGNTEVLAGIHIATTTPYPDSPDEGTFMVSAELHPMASNNFEMGKPGINAVELSRVTDRGIRESGLINTKKLCIEKGEKVWQVFVDIIAINDDGNLFDAAGLAAIIALGKARMPIYNKEEDKTEGYSEKEKLPLNKEVLSFNMTFHKIGNKIVADVNSEEETISDYRLSIAVGDNKGEPRITAMQKGKAGAITTEDLNNILELVEETYKKKFGEIKEYVFGK